MLPDCAVYAKALLLKKYGFPFWLTEPHGNLPYDYRISGVQIGDVLIFTPDGGYDFMFNIFLSKDHPINAGRVPDNFDPLPLSPCLDLSFRDDWQNPGTEISNSSAEKLNLTGNASAVIPGIPAEFGGGFEFRSRSSSGGILVLPEGAARVDYNKHHQLRHYIDANIDSWFEHINGDRFDRDTNDLYIVTGCDKASESGVASFSNLSDGQEISLKFTAANITMRASYSWSSRHSAATRVTPVVFSDGQKKQNQCVFARGFTYTKNPLSIRRGTRVKVSDLSRAKPWKSGESKNKWGLRPFGSNSSRSPASSSKSSPSPSSSPTSSCSSSTSPIPTQPFTPTASCELEDQTNFQPPSESSDSASSTLSSDDSDSESGIEDCGFQYPPSKIINEYILAVEDDVDYFVTHDDDWCSLEFQDPSSLFDPDALLRAATSKSQSSLITDSTDRVISQGDFTELDFPAEPLIVLSPPVDYLCKESYTSASTDSLIDDFNVASPPAEAGRWEDIPETGSGGTYGYGGFVFQVDESPFDSVSPDPPLQPDCVVSRSHFDNTYERSRKANLRRSASHLDIPQLQPHGNLFPYGNYVDNTSWLPETPSSSLSVPSPTFPYGYLDDLSWDGSQIQMVQTVATDSLETPTSSDSQLPSLISDNNSSCDSEPTSARGRHRLPSRCDSPHTLWRSFSRETAAMGHHTRPSSPNPYQYFGPTLSNNLLGHDLALPTLNSFEDVINGLGPADAHEIPPSPYDENAFTMLRGEYPPAEQHISPSESQTGFRFKVGSDAMERAANGYKKRPGDFKCDISGCSATFTAKHHLHNHINAHMGIRNYKRPDSTRLMIHPLLQYTHGQSPQLTFNVSSAPVEPYPGCFAEAATHPPLPSLAITIPNVPWTLIVHHSLLPYVTIGDVLNMIWTSLQLPLDEYSRRGTRRIDLLRGKHRFLGISTSQVGEETFVLHTT